MKSLIDQLRAELAQQVELNQQQAAVIEQMREWIEEATHSLDCAKGMAQSRFNETPIECVCFKSKALALQPSAEVLAKVKADAVAKFAKYADDYEVDKLAAEYIQRLLKGEV